MSMTFDSQRPIFIQLAAQLEDAILAGVYDEGDQIPSITEYSLTYKINPATALKGINLLVDSGLLYKRRGVGMFVAEGARKTLAKRRRESFFTQSVLPAVGEAKNLGIALPELINMIERGYKNGN